MVCMDAFGAHTLASCSAPTALIVVRGPDCKFAPP